MAARLRADVPSNVGLLASGALFVLVALRILAVAHFDVTTAAAILQRSGTSTVLLGAVLATVPSLIAASAPLLSAAVVLSSKTSFRGAPVRTGLTAVVFVLWLLFVPMAIAVPVSLAMVAATLLHTTLSRRASRSPEAVEYHSSLEPVVVQRDGTRVTASVRDALLIHANDERIGVLVAKREALLGEIETLVAELLGFAEGIGEVSSQSETTHPGPSVKGTAVGVADQGGLGEAVDDEPVKARLNRMKAVVREKRGRVKSLEAVFHDLGDQIDTLRNENVEAGVRAERRIELNQSYRHKTDALNTRNNRAVASVLLLVSAAILLTSLPVPWLPPERVNVDDTDGFRAYVLDKTEDELVVLRASDRSVVVLSDARHPRRVLCSARSTPWEQSFLSVVLGQPYPACPG